MLLFFKGSVRNRSVPPSPAGAMELELHGPRCLLILAGCVDPRVDEGTEPEQGEIPTLIPQPFLPEQFLDT